MKPGRIFIREAGQDLVDAGVDPEWIVAYHVKNHNAKRFFEIQCQPHVSIKLRRLFGGAQRLYKSVNQFKIAATPAHAYELDWFRQMHPLDLDPSCAKEFGRLVRIHKKRMADIAEIGADDYVPHDHALAKPPRQYQSIGADLALKTRQLLCADQVGLGKTVLWFCVLAHKMTRPAIVVTENHLQRQWEEKLAEFLPDLTVHRLRSGTPYVFKGRRERVEQPDGTFKMIPIPEKPDVIIVNYEKLHGWADTLAEFAVSIVFDECQSLRIPGSLKYNAAKALAHQCTIRGGLTATPVHNYGVEIWSVLDVIAPDSLGSREEFISEWCGGSGDGSAEDSRKVCVRDPQALGTYLREQGLMIRRTRKEVGRELPSLTIVRHVVEVNPARIHEAVADVAELAQRILDRVGSPFERMKWSSEIDYRLRVATGIGKAPAVVDFVRLLVEADEPVLLFGYHHAVYDIYCDGLKRAGIPFAMFTGKQSEAEKSEAVRQFLAGEVWVLIMSIRAGAGLDGLQHICCNVVHGELDWSPKPHEQGTGRVHRDGQTDKVNAWFMVAEEGSDPVIADTIGLKESQARGIVSPDEVGEPIFVGPSEDHMRTLAEDVLRRYQAKIAKGIIGVGGEQVA